MPKKDGSELFKQSVLWITSELAYEEKCDLVGHVNVCM